MKSILTKRAEAYRDATRVDAIINELLVLHPMEKEPEYWMTYCRTVKSGLDMIEATAMEHVKMQARY